MYMHCILSGFFPKIHPIWRSFPLTSKCLEPQLIALLCFSYFSLCYETDKYKDQNEQNKSAEQGNQLLEPLFCMCIINLLGVYKLFSHSQFQAFRLARLRDYGWTSIYPVFFIGQSATWCHLEILNLRARNCAIRKLFAQLATEFPKLLIVRLSMTLEDNKLFSERDTHSKR